MVGKIVTLSIIVIASAIMGNVVVRSADQRLTALVTLMNCGKAMKNCLVFQRMTLFEALKHCDKIGMDGLFGRMAELMRECPGVNLFQICRMALSEGGEALALIDGKAQQALVNFIVTAGSASIPQMIADAYGEFAKELGGIISEMKNQQMKKARAVRSLCMLGGIMIAIVLA